MTLKKDDHKKRWRREFVNEGMEMTKLLHIDVEPLHSGDFWIRSTDQIYITYDEFCSAAVSPVANSGHDLWGLFSSSTPIGIAEKLWSKPAMLCEFDESDI